MNLRTLCIFFVLVACFSIAFAIEWEDLQAKELGEGSGYAEPEGSGVAEVESPVEVEPEGVYDEEPQGFPDAGPAEGSAAPKTKDWEDLAKKDEKKTDESATPAKGAAVIGSFFTIGLYSDTAIAP
ncbi:hypothetical protein CAEBREN_06576 [Caenorhabditis brenneri]|uniref:Secreted protein n=1 Tax=Caenorhabditis brenneri TaxID=135651 RepID=G0NXJ9_CAEBE|nr:hypothetical protein CAEBREN_06576 [Caenorhabditis brenneri]